MGKANAVDEKGLTKSAAKVRRRFTTSLSEKQHRFIDEYLVDMSAGPAAIRAGYSPKSAHKSGFQLLRNPHIRDEIDKRKTVIAERNGITVEWLVQQYKRIVMQDIRKLYNYDGSMKLPHELDDDTAFTITSMEVKTGKHGTTTSKAFRADQLRALDSLAKYKKMFSDDATKSDTNIVVKFVGGLPQVEDDT